MRPRDETKRGVALVLAWRSEAELADELAQLVPKPPESAGWIDAYVRLCDEAAHAGTDLTCAGVPLPINANQARFLAAKLERGPEFREEREVRLILGALARFRVTIAPRLAWSPRSGRWRLQTWHDDLTDEIAAEFDQHYADRLEERLFKRWQWQTSVARSDRLRVVAEALCKVCECSFGLTAERAETANHKTCSTECGAELRRSQSWKRQRRLARKPRKPPRCCSVCAGKLPKGNRSGKCGACWTPAELVDVGRRSGHLGAPAAGGSKPHRKCFLPYKKAPLTAEPINVRPAVQLENGGAAPHERQHGLPPVRNPTGREPSQLLSATPMCRCANPRERSGRRR